MLLQQGSCLWKGVASILVIQVHSAIFAGSTQPGTKYPASFRPIGGGFWKFLVGLSWPHGHWENPEMWVQSSKRGTANLKAISKD